MEEIKIFVASSILNFKSERKSLAVLFSGINNRAIKQNVFLNVKFCEEMDNAIGKTRKQDEYNKHINESDMVIFLIDQECHPYTMEEFDTAIGDNSISHILVFQKQENIVKEKDKSVRAMEIKAEKSRKVTFIEYVNFSEVEQYITNIILELYNYDYSDLNKKNSVKNLKVIQCFLAGNQEKHMDEKNELIRFALNLNETLLDNDCYLNIEPCTTNQGIKQARDIKCILGSDLVFFIFFDHVKNNEKEELKLAVDHFHRNNVPKIFTYFWNDPVNNIENSSIEELKNYIDKEFQHFYSLFTTIDSIKLSLLLQVVWLTENKMNARLYNGEVSTEQEVLLTLEQLPIFKNNVTLNTLKKNLENIKYNYRKTVMQFGMEPEKTELLSKITALNNERENIEKKIQREETAIWDMLIEMNKNIANRNVDKLLKAAYRHIENGEIDKAAKILNKEKIDQMVKPILKNDIDILKEDAKKAINLYKQAIVVQKMLVETQKTFQEIENDYLEIMEILEQIPYIDCIEALEFAEFYDSYNSIKAEAVYKQIEVMLSNKLRSTNKETWIKFYRGYGKYLVKQKRFDEAMDNLKKYLDLSAQLYRTDTHKYAIMFSDACMWLFMVTKSKKNVMRGCLALERRYKESRTRENAIALANYYNQAGLNSDENEAAKDFFDRAIKLLESEVIEDVTLANAYLNYAEYIRIDISEETIQNNEYNKFNNCTDIKEIMKLFAVNVTGTVAERNMIEKYINRAIGIYEKLSENDSENTEIIMALGDAYNNFAIFLEEYDENHYWASQYLKKGEKHYEKLYYMNPMKYGISYGENFIQLGYIHESMGNKKRAVKNTLKGVQIIESVYNINKSRFADKLAWAYMELGLLYKILEDIEEEMACYRKSLEIIEDVNEIDPTPMLVRQITKVLYAVTLSWRNIKNFEELPEDEIILFDKIFRLGLNWVDENPVMIKSLNDIGRILMLYFEKQDKQIAKEYYRMMIKLDRKYLESEYLEEDDKFNVNFELAMLYGLIGQADEGTIYLEKSALVAMNKE